MSPCLPNLQISKDAGIRLSQPNGHEQSRAVKPHGTSGFNDLAGDSTSAYSGHLGNFVFVGYLCKVGDFLVF